MRVVLNKTIVERKVCSVHRLIAEVFLGDAPSERPIVNHKSGDTGDNRPENLEWANYSENAYHASRVLGARLGQRNGRAVLTEAIVREARERYAKGGIGHHALAKEYGVSGTCMSLAVQGKTWKHVPGGASVSPTCWIDEQAKVTDDTVREIRRRYDAGGVSHARLAREYAVSASLIGKIVRREAWKNVK